MDVLPDEDEQLVKETARQFLADHATPALARGHERDPDGYSRDLWKRMAELGWQGMCLPEEHGGQDLPLTYAGLVLGEIGRHVAPVPLHSTLVAGLTLAAYGEPAVRDRVLPAIVSGDLVATVAVHEAGTIDDTDIAAQATRDGEDYVINGSKPFVDNGTLAGLIVVATRLDDGELALFAVERESAGVSITPMSATAKDPHSRLDLVDVRVPATHRLGASEPGATLVRFVLDHAAALLCAQMAGATRKDMEMAVEYSKMRHAFGHPIGSFQAIRHLEADMLIAVDGADLLTNQALWKLGSRLPASVEVSQAKSFCNERCMFVIRSSQQIHGGIGFTLEFDLQLWYRRVASWGLRYGSTHEHRQRIAQALIAHPGDQRIRFGDPVVLP